MPTFRVAAGGSLIEAQVSLRAAYEDVEIDVRADGMTVPVIVKPPTGPQGRTEGVPLNASSRRAKCIRCDIAAQQAAAAKLRDLGLVPAEDGNKFVAHGDDAIRFWTEGIASLPDDWDIFVPDDLVDVQLRDETLSANARVSSGVDWLSLRLNFESEGVAVTQEELARCLDGGPEVRSPGRRLVRQARPPEGARGAAAPGRDPGDGRRQRRQAPALAGGAHRGAARAGRSCRA